MNKVCLMLISTIILVAFMLPANAGEARKRLPTLLNQGTTIEDVEAEITFGRELAARILGNYSLLDDDVLTRYINLVGYGVALYAGRPELKFHFGILDTAEVNAFAAPGGYIFITRAALEQMDNEAQLAGVLGHEIAHVVKKHVIRELDIRAVNGTAAGGMISLVSGSTGSLKGALETALENATDILFRKGYKAEDEIEADRTGMFIVSAAGYDPAALKVFLEKVGRFEKNERNTGSDHPVYAARMREINETLSKFGLEHIGTAKVRERFYENVHK